MKHIKELELNRIKALEEEYHKQGYEVFLEPAPDQLPDFLKSFQPDMIVLKDEEKKVIEVKTRITLSKNPQTREIARLINEQEGWGFEIVVVKIDEDAHRFEGMESCDEEDILYRIEDAKKLIDSGHSEAAFLYVWSASEAALRLLVKKEALDVKSFMPSHIIKALTIEGVISRDHYKLLMSAMKTTDTVVHGYKSDDFKSDIIQKIIDFTEEIIKQYDEVLSA